MNIFNWVSDHKTRVVGYVTVVTGTLVTLDEPLRDLLTRREMAAFTIFVGIVTAICGHLNASKSSDPPSE